MVLFNSDKLSPQNKMEVLEALQNFDLNPDVPFVIITLDQYGNTFMRKLNCDSNDLKMFAMDLLEDSILHSVAMSDDYMDEIREENGYMETEDDFESHDENDDEWELK